MKTATKMITALGAALAMGSASASPVNVGGVVWDPEALFDFSTVDTMVETIVADGDTLSGYAKITTMNGTSEATFCPGCELTYVFDNYVASSVATGFAFSGGTISVYVDNTPNFDATLASTAADGVLFLSLAAAEHIDTATGNTGTLHSDPTPTASGVLGDGRGFLNVVGGLAAGNFDTDVFNITTPAGPATADFSFTSSFQLIPDGAGGSQTFVSDDGVEYGILGGNDLIGASIPEPAPIALGGLALLGMFFSQRRRRA